MSKVLFKDWYKAVEQKLDDPVAIVTLDTPDGGIPVDVRKRLTFEERFRMIRDIASLCVKDGVCARDFLRFAIDYCMLNYYTNLNCDVSLEHIYELITMTDIVKKVIGVIGIVEYRRICADAESACVEDAGSLRQLELLAARINKFLDEVDNETNAESGEELDNLLKLANRLDSLSQQDIVNNVIEMHKKSDTE